MRLNLSQRKYSEIWVLLCSGTELSDCLNFFDPIREVLVKTEDTLAFYKANFAAQLSLSIYLFIRT